MVFQPKLVPRCAFIPPPPPPPPSVCQISRQSDNAFAFYSSFCKCAKRGRKIRRKQTKKLSQFLKANISGMPEAISLKFGMWSTEVGGNVHSKIRLVSSRQHRATEVRKLRFLSSCQYSRGCAPASWAARHTTVCLDNCFNKNKKFVMSRADPPNIIMRGLDITKNTAATTFPLKDIKLP